MGKTQFPVYSVALKTRTGVGEMAQCLRALATLAGAPDSVSSTHMMANS